MLNSEGMFWLFNIEIGTQYRSFECGEPSLKLKFYHEIYKNYNSFEFKEFYKNYKQSYRKVIVSAKTYEVSKKMYNSGKISKTSWKILNKF